MSRRKIEWLQLFNSSHFNGTLMFIYIYFLMLLKVFDDKCFCYKVNIFSQASTILITLVGFPESGEHYSINGMLV